MQTDVVVIGAGVAGLTAAVALSGQGRRVLVLEAASRPGGRACSWRDEVTGDEVDLGPHVLHTAYRNLLGLLDRVGTRDAVLWQHDCLLKLVDEGRTYEMPACGWIEPLHLLPAMRRAPLSLADKLSNWRVTLAALRLREDRLTELDRLSASDYLAQQGVSPRFAEWFWASVAIAILNLPLRQCSAGALMRFYRQMIGRNDARIGFATTGLNTLIAEPARRYVAAHGGEVRCEARVARLDLRDGRLAAVELEDGQRIEAGAGVVAVAPDEIAALLPADAPVANAAPAFETPEPCPYVCTYLWFARKLTAERFWARTWGPDKVSCDSYDLSNIREGWAGRPSVIASNIIYSHRVRDWSDERIVEAVRRDIAEHLPDAATTPLLHCRVHRVAMSIPAPRPGFEALRPCTQTAIRNLVLASDWVDTGLPACMESAACAGWRAAERLLAGDDRPTALAQPPAAPRGLVGWLSPGDRAAA